MNETRLYKLCQQSIRQSQGAFEMGAYEAAYHMLVAALEFAKDLHDGEVLLDIASAANAQLAWIDTYQPDHKYSTLSATHRNQASLLVTLARRAKLEAQILQSETERQYHWQLVKTRPKSAQLHLV